MTTTITTQTVRYYNTRGTITGTENFTGDAIDADYGDIKPVAPHGLNLSAMKSLATSSDPIDRVLVSQQRNITKALTKTLAQDADLDVLWHLGVNRAVDPRAYMDGMGVEHPLVQDVLRLDEKVGDDKFKLLVTAMAAHRFLANMLLAYADSTDVDILATMAKEHPHLLVREAASANHRVRITGHYPDCSCAHSDNTEGTIDMVLDVLAEHFGDTDLEVSVITIRR